jgi:hypothetical protein
LIDCVVWFLNPTRKYLTKNQKKYRLVGNLVRGWNSWMDCLPGWLPGSRQLSWNLWFGFLVFVVRLLHLGRWETDTLLVMDEPSTSWEGNGRLQRGRLEMKDGWLVMGGAPDRCMHGIASSVSFHFECMYVLSRVDDLHF